ncbi:MAG: hypothetical protein H6883_08125 [Rhodobiaceae bacterium]|nr:hypothetical protein [Rhodobiaceae bacterium]MCC0056089.1 hypothetical protein [Rhodobiaceae bacterium]
MSGSESDLYTRFLCKSQNYFEFGMGGSTVLAAGLVKDRIWSVDSDIAWLEKTREAIGQSLARVNLIHVDIGPTGAWGRPVGKGHEDKFAAYSKAIRQRDMREVDFCLVDGRFRVACFLTALAWLDKGAVLAVHDYRARPQYHVVEKFARPIAEAGNICMFVRRASTSRMAINRMAERYRKDPN